MRIASAQYNYAYGDQIHYPYSIATLAAYADTQMPGLEWLPTCVLRSKFDEHVARCADADVLLCSCYVWNWEITTELARRVKAINPGAFVIFGGPQVPDEWSWFEHRKVADIAVHGEGERLLVDALCDLGTREWPSQRIDDLADLPSPYTSGMMDRLAEDVGDLKWIATWETNRGCPYQCLAGDTEVNTVYGKIAIRQLAELFSEVGVCTYDRNEKRAKVCIARNIRRTGINKSLVRVHFDDGTHVDCTPDHQFLAFKWGNQFVGEREWIEEAKDLKPGTRVRAIKEGMNGEYPEIAWSRHKREMLHRLVGEWKKGSPLLPTEEVHHLNRDKRDYSPENLEVKSSHLDHVADHPELAERMRTCNPTRNGLSQEWRDNLAQSNRGKVRSPESRERYRVAALKRESSKTEEERSAQAFRSADTKRRTGVPMGNPHRDSENGRFTGNHHVISVEPLPGLHDVYCLEVPNTGWFYANDVLVKNCSFCDWGSATYTKLRQYPMERLKAEADWFVARRIPYIDNADANFGILPRDAEIAAYLADAVTRAGAHMTYRQSWAKNTTARVIDIARTLQGANLLTAVGLAVEALDAPTLSAIKRKNLPFKKFSDLTKQFAANGLPTYTEVIRGLPGQTLAAFTSDLGQLIDNADIGQIMVYNCSVLVNAPMAAPAYMKQYGIKTVRAPIFLRHSDAARQDVIEYEDIVCETSAMTRDEMARAYAYTWIIQLGESLGMMDQLSCLGRSRMDWYDAGLDWCATHQSSTLGGEYRRMGDYVRRGYAGDGWDEHDAALGPILWPIEEASWLRLMRDRDALFASLHALTVAYGYASTANRAVRSQLSALEWCPPGRDYFDWARDVLWYGRRQQRFRKHGVRVAA